MTDLLKCPFCDGPPRKIIKRGKTGTACPSRYFRGTIVCRNCGASSGMKSSPKKMVDAWNTRVDNQKVDNNAS